MTSRLARRLTILSLLLATMAGCVFSVLNEDLEKLDDVSHLFTGTVSTEVLQFHATVVVALEDREAANITSFRMMSGPGVFEIRMEKSPNYFFAFGDMNKDLRFQPDEPYAWAAAGEAVIPTNGATFNVDITIGAADQPPFPRRLVDLPLEDHLNNYVRTHVGTVSSLDNHLFSNMQGRKGLWQPFAFMEDGGTGLHFLEPYDSNKIPVLFVHGINGSPQDFASLIEQLDRSSFQPWVLSYPSGLRLSWLARGMFQFIEVLHRQYNFDELHVVAHSMGGLVSRGTLNLCSENHACKYLRSFTSLSTPWNGVDSAQSGVKWAPTVIPVWHDLDPASEYVTTLFDTPLPNDVPFHLVFGYQQDSILATESSDGVIKLNSQLRDAAQEQAETIRGYDEGHVSILRSKAAIGNINAILLETR